MARYTDATCRLCRREGLKLYIKGDRCYSDKCAMKNRDFAPGQHGQMRKKVSEYGLQLREKQKVRRIYGIQEKQFYNYFVKAEKQKGVTGEILLQMLELRLDNVVYRLGFAASRSEARQLIRHGHFKIDGKKVNIPSYLTKEGETISASEKSKSSPKFAIIKETAEDKTVPEWLDADSENLIGKIVSLPTREDIDIPITEQLVVELYSR